MLQSSHCEVEAYRPQCSSPKSAWYRDLHDVNVELHRTKQLSGTLLLIMFVVPGRQSADYQRTNWLRLTPKFPGSSRTCEVYGFALFCLTQVWGSTYHE